MTRSLCPDCRQLLNEPQRPCAYLDGEAVWCATCEYADRPKQSGAARLDPLAVRVPASFRLHPDTVRRIGREAKRTGESRGQVVDRLARGL